LLLSGVIETALILVPASVMKQWQEELVEKFLLDIPRLENRCLLDRGRGHGHIDQNLRSLQAWQLVLGDTP